MNKRNKQDTFRLSVEAGSHFHFIGVLILFLAASALPAFGLTVNEAAELLADDGASGDQFGASVSISDDWAMVGSNNGVYVFVREEDGTWTQHDVLLGPIGGGGSYYRVSVSGDTAVIGAPDNDGPPCSAYIFVRGYDMSGQAVWTQQATLPVSPSFECDAVSVSGDTAVVNVGLFAGGVEVFVRNGATWTHQATLAPSDSASHLFGLDVSLSDNTVVIGDLLNPVNDPFFSFGAVYVFVRNGATWTQEAKLLANDRAPNDVFGVSVSISGDTAVIGAEGDDDNGNLSGSAYVFVRGYDMSGQAVWTQQAKLLASDGSMEDIFGRNVSVSGDKAVVGASQDDDNGENSGSAYLFVRGYDMSGQAVWTQQAKLLASDGSIDDFFGGGCCLNNSVSVSGDTAVIGADFHDHIPGDLSGSAYVFNLRLDPRDLIADLIEKVMGLNLNAQLENGLVAKLVAAFNALDDGNPHNDHVAINKLEDFISQVGGVSGNQIDTSDGDELISDAQAIIDLLEELEAAAP